MPPANRYEPETSRFEPATVEIGRSGPGPAPSVVEVDLLDLDSRKGSSARGDAGSDTAYAMALDQSDLLEVLDALRNADVADRIRQAD